MQQFSVEVPGPRWNHGRGLEAGAMTINTYIGAYILSIFGGWAFVNIGLKVIRTTVKEPHEFFAPLDFWLGGTERCVATTLILFAPRYLPTFIGGWVVLKFAANWQRHKGTEFGQPSLIALLGSVLSFAAAIGATLYMRPDLINSWVN
jgi:hypothetical protein